MHVSLKKRKYTVHESQQLWGGELGSLVKRKIAFRMQLQGDFSLTKITHVFTSL